MRQSMHFKDVPFQLQATDIKKHILNVDSRFREAGGSSSDFYFRLLSPVKNVLRIRITSIELPNNYYLFSKIRRNVTLRIMYGVVDPSSNPRVYLNYKDITIPEGNYSAFNMVDGVNAALAAAGLTWIKVSFNLITGKFVFYTTPLTYFALDTALEDVLPPITWNRPYDYGLGYNMGFSSGIFDSGAGVDISGNPSQVVVSDQFAYFAGDIYHFLKINDFDCVRQTNVGSDFTALAKIIIRDPKNFMTYDDYASQHVKEVTFPTPQDLSRLHVQLLDMYGELTDMGSAQVSFSIEVLEIMNLSLYNTIRDAFAIGWTV